MCRSKEPPTRFGLAINLTTAKAFRLTIAKRALARADKAGGKATTSCSRCAVASVTGRRRSLPSSCARTSGVPLRTDGIRR